VCAFLLHDMAMAALQSHSPSASNRYKADGSCVYSKTNPNTNPIQLFYAFFEHRHIIFKLAKMRNGMCTTSVRYGGIKCVTENA